MDEYRACIYIYLTQKKYNIVDTATDGYTIIYIIIMSVYIFE